LVEKFFTAELSNGMTLLGQQMGHVSSAAMAVLVPGGASYCPDGSEGAAAVGCEWCLRGAGQRDTRALNDALDSLGTRHDELVRGEHIAFTVAQLGRNLPEVLRIYADIILRPRLESETFEPCRDLVQQDLAALEDEPARKCNMLLREKFYPYPLGRCVYGDAESLRAMGLDAVRTHVSQTFRPGGSILAVAGDVDWGAFRRLAEECFGQWDGENSLTRQIRPPEGGVTHIPKDSSQTHIAIAHRSVTIGSEHYYPARVAEMVLSGGMASRLFTEVREKRGLVYHVSARYHSLKDHAGIFTYAGTTPENAQETFDVTLGELVKLSEGITSDELARAKTQLKSALIMQGESSEARSAALANDWYHLHRLRGLSELSEAIDKVTADDVMEYLASCPAEDFTVLIIGPDPVNTQVTGE